MNILLLAENSNKLVDDLLTVLILVLFVLFLVGYKILEKKRLNAPKKEEAVVPVKVASPRVRKQIKLEDIKDENMMVACLIATIDYANEIKEDVHLVSVREL